jgi:hypothetical protein
MKTTEYFKHTRLRSDRKDILDEWIEFVITHAEHTEVQEDGRVKKWAKIDKVGKYLRVILLEDKETVHNAFFDRRYKGIKDES